MPSSLSYLDQYQSSEIAGKADLLELYRRGRVGDAAVFNAWWIETGGKNALYILATRFDPSAIDTMHYAVALGGSSNRSVYASIISRVVNEVAGRVGADVIVYDLAPGGGTLTRALLGVVDRLVLVTRGDSGSMDRTLRVVSSMLESGGFRCRGRVYDRIVTAITSVPINDCDPDSNCDNWRFDEDAVVAVTRRYGVVRSRLLESGCVIPSSPVLVPLVRDLYAPVHDVPPAAYVWLRRSEYPYCTLVYSVEAIVEKIIV